MMAHKAGRGQIPPAVVLITCDQLKRNALGCYGARAITTPYIDSLAAEGTRYENCRTVSPWCLPARCSILTGLYPHHNRAYSNFRQCALDTEIDNLFFSMRRSGYHTTLFGKCHFAPVPYSQKRPDATLPYDEFKAYYESLGIDHLVLQDDKQVSVWFYDDYSKELERAGYLDAYREAAWNKANKLVFPFPGSANWHPDAWTGRKAADYIRQYEREKPLFAWISFSGPHYPFDTPAEYLEQVDPAGFPPFIKQAGEFDGGDRILCDSYHGGPNAIVDGARVADGNACKNYMDDYWMRMRTSYYGNVKLIDDQVGEIIAAVREAYGEDALILFTADHGEMLGNHGIWGKNICAYEEVLRIPLVVRYPGPAKPAIDERLVNSTDYLPTCLKAAETDIPPCDGRALQDQEWERKYTFAEGEGFLAVTDGDCKYIHLQRQNQQGRELLDLKKDPHEFENLIERPEYQKKLAQLRSAMIEHIMTSVLA